MPPDPPDLIAPAGPLTDDHLWNSGSNSVYFVQDPDTEVIVSSDIRSSSNQSIHVIREIGYERLTYRHEDGNHRPIVLPPHSSGSRIWVSFYADGSVINRLKYKETFENVEIHCDDRNDRSYDARRVICEKNRT